jgi:hypothetical protein
MDRAATVRRSGKLARSGVAWSKDSGVFHPIIEEYLQRTFRVASAKLQAQFLVFASSEASRRASARGEH